MPSAIAAACRASTRSSSPRSPATRSRAGARAHRCGSSAVSRSRCSARWRGTSSAPTRRAAAPPAAIAPPLPAVVAASALPPAASGAAAAAADAGRTGRHAAPRVAAAAPAAPRAAAASEAQRRPAEADSRIYAPRDLPESVRRELPNVTVGGSTYSTNSASRMLMINGQIFHEGDTVARGVVLQQIKPRAAVFAYKGYRYEMTF